MTRVLILVMLLNSFGSSLSVYATTNSEKEVRNLTEQEFVMQERFEYARRTRIYFGNNNHMWWNTGKQKEDTLVLYAAQAMGIEQNSFFNSSIKNKINSELWEDCIYPDGLEIKEVYANHYGASDIRKRLKPYEDSYFTLAERELMNTSTIYTFDERNKVSYALNDVLCLPQTSENPGSSQLVIYVGENSPENLYSGLQVSQTYWNHYIPGNKHSWTRTPSTTSNGKSAYHLDDKVNVSWVNNDWERGLKPFFQLNTSSVLFMSSIPCISQTGYVQSETTTEPYPYKNNSKEITGAFTLRYKTSNIGNAEVSFNKKYVKLTDVPEGTYLVAQNSNGGYAKAITDESIISAQELGLTSFDKAKVWLESTNVNERKTYATLATQEEGRTVQVIGNTGLSFITSNTNQLIQPGTAIEDIIVEVQQGYFLPNDYENQLIGMEGLQFVRTNNGFKIIGTPNKNVYLELPPLSNYINVSHTFKSMNEEILLPKVVLEQIPNDIKIKYGETAKPSISSFEDIVDGDGKWIFKGWDKTEVPNVTTDVKFTGTWEYQPNFHTIDYVFEKDETDMEFPDTITVPTSVQLKQGEKVPYPEIDSPISVEGGTWDFIGWKPNQPTIVGTEDITIIGTWKFTPNTYVVNYEFVSGSDGKTIPEDFPISVPNSTTVKHGTTITPPMDFDLIVDDGENGRWKFDGWSPTSVTITDDSTFTGTWIYQEKQKIIAENLTVYEGGLGSNNSTSVGDALPEPTWAGQIGDYEVTVDGKEWNIQTQGLPFKWEYQDENGNKVESSARVGEYGLHVYPLDGYEGKDVFVNGKLLVLPEDGLKVSTVKVRDITDDEKADTLSSDLFKKVYDYESPQEEQNFLYKAWDKFISFLGFDKDNDNISDNGTHTDKCNMAEPHAHVKQGTKFLKNGVNELPVNDNARIALLWDDLLENVLGSQERMEKLHDKSLQAINEDIFNRVGTIHREFKYIDLVDMNDGNVWVGTVNDVTVYVPYPAGVDKTDEIAVTYYDGLTRDYTIDMNNADLDVEIDNSNAHPVNNLRKTDTGILFDVPSKQFGPVEIMWQKSYKPSYEFKSSDETELAEEIRAIQKELNESSTAYAEGLSIPAPSVVTEVKTDNGIWNFLGWDEKSKVSSNDTKFIGTWKYSPYTTPLNKIPVITANDKTFTVGDEFNNEIALKDVSAYDEEDGDVTASLKVVDNNVDTSTVGTYFITYKATDKDGASRTKTINVTVLPKTTPINRIPVITANDKTFTVGDEFNNEIALKDVTAYDEEDGDVTSSLEVVDHNVDTSTTGTYFITYKATDKDGASSTKTVEVTVLPELTDINNIPVISAEDKELNVGDGFDPRKDVTATDKEDGDLTDVIEIIENTVDTSKAGTYYVTYKVTDKDGASFVKTIKVVVKDKEVIPEPTPEEPATPETPQKPEQPATPAEKPDSNIPQTGDNTNVNLWISLIAVSGMMLAVFGIRRKKRQ